MKAKDLTRICDDFMRYLESEGVTALLLMANKVGDEYETLTTAVAPDNLPEWKDVLAATLRKSMNEREYLTEIVKKATMV